MKKIFVYTILILFSIFPLLLSTKLLFLIDPPIWPDEPVFLNMAQNILTTGKPSAHIIGNIIPGVDLTGFGYPPLYFLVLGVWTKILGTNIEVVRALSLSLALLCLVVFFFIIKNLLNSLLFAGLGTFILALNVHFSRAARLGRMEILVLFSLLLSFLFLLKAQQKHDLKITFLGGIISGIAVLVHPMGLIVPLIFILGSILSFENLRQKILATILASTPVLLFGALWLIYMRDDLKPLINTYQAQFGDKSAKEAFIFTLFANYFLWRLLLILYTTIFLFFILHLKKHFSKGNFLLFTALIVTLFFSILGKENSYFVYNQPFITLAFVILIFHWLKQRGDMIKFMALFFCASLILISFSLQLLFNDNLLPGQMSTIPFWQFHQYDYHKLTKEVISTLPQNQKINIYLNSAPDPYFDLKSNPNFTLYEGTILPASDASFKKLWDSMDYMIITWIPQQLLSDYINRNSEKITKVSQSEGYNILVIKLQPKSKRL